MTPARSDQGLGSLAPHRFPVSSAAEGTRKQLWSQGLEGADPRLLRAPAVPAGRGWTRGCRAALRSEAAAGAPSSVHTEAMTEHQGLECPPAAVPPDWTPVPALSSSWIPDGLWRTKADPTLSLAALLNLPVGQS